MEYLNNILAKLGLSMKNFLILLVAAVGLWFVLGNRAKVYRRARRVSTSVARRARTGMRRVVSRAKRTYKTYRRGRSMRK
jgi:uncharacterized membrane protein